MSTPPINSALSSSPARTIRIDVAHPHPSRSGSDDRDREHQSNPNPRRSPTLVRTPDPNDPVAQERQRSLDVDSALQLSRARSGSVYAAHPRFVHSLSHSHPLPHAHQINPEVQPGTSPPTSRPNSSSGASATNAGYPFLTHSADEIERSLSDLNGGVGTGVDAAMFNQHLSHAHDPSLLVSLSSPGVGVAPGAVSGESLLGALPVYQPAIGPLNGAARSHFDFAAMEAFARNEKRNLGIASRSPSDPQQQLRWASSSMSSVQRPPPPPVFSSSPPQIEHSMNAASVGFADAEALSVAAEGFRGHDNLKDDNVAPTADGTLAPTASEPIHSKDVSPDSSSARLRQRKLSLSNSAKPRNRRAGGGKMALFEGAYGAPPPTFGAPGTAAKGRFSPMPSYEHIPQVGATSSGETPALPQLPPPIYGLVGHERPYRFSFYSNKLAATIHARSLSELPAEGQLFEDLFFGANRAMVADDGMNKPKPGDSSNKLNGLIPTPSDEEVSAWWLDVLSPTDEEMKLLSKVFGIHPLTTEDIQMEETREKIELFRNYYLVSFRSFDQDPYSPTYLEPLNMYIIVFREGTLSFHFRSTPHPQNVRRRIKQLKDYISVTSDWISYALIDDITDAFAPLIQNIEYEVDSIDELVLILKEAEQSDMLRRIGTCRKKVMGLLRLMGNKADVVKGLAKRCNENWNVAPKSDIGLYLSDIQDHLITMTQNLNHYEKILSRSHSNYLAQISIEMTDANNQINDVLSKLTALGTVLIPMNLVTGLWGMNVNVPGETANGYAWFGGIIGGLVGFALIGGILTYRLMRR